jgi:hypothetical protein
VPLGDPRLTDPFDVARDGRILDTVTFVVRGARLTPADDPDLSAWASALVKGSARAHLVWVIDFTESGHREHRAEDTAADSHRGRHAGQRAHPPDAPGR